MNRTASPDRRFLLPALGLALVTAAVMSAEAHSLKDVESRLSEREKYFQPIDEDAPGFELEDADGRTVRLADLRRDVRARRPWP